MDTPSPNQIGSAPTLPPKKKLPHKNHPGWDIFWVIMAIIIISLQYYFLVNITIPLAHYLPIALGALIGLIITFFISSKLVVDGYSISKQAICYMGSIKSRRTEKLNTKALVFFLIFGLLYGVLNFCLMHLYITYFSEITLLRYSAYFLFISTLVILMMVFIPIDIHEYKHLSVALLVFTITEIASGVSAAYFIRNQINFPLLYVVVIIEFTLAVIYVWGYNTNYRYTAVFQKSCIMTTGVAFYLYLSYFIPLL
jgi:hypothetical protein